MNTIVGKIRDIIYSSQNNNFKVYSFYTKDHKKIKVCGSFDEPPDTNSIIEFNGDYKDHPKYGTSFYAISYNYTYDQTKEGLYYYLQAIAKWLGPVRTEKIIEHFQDNLEKVIEEDYEKLAEVPGIGIKIAKAIKEAWDENKKQKDVKIFLFSIGLSTIKVDKILRYVGTDAEEIIRSNPWYLTQIAQLSFSVCDSLASKLNKDPDDINRYYYFIIHVLKEVTNSGHIYININSFKKLFVDYNKSTYYCFKKVNNNDEFLKILTNVIQLLKKDKKIVIWDNNVYYLPLFVYEYTSAFLIDKIIKTKPDFEISDEYVLEFIKDYEQRYKITLEREQKEAIISFFKVKVLVLTGPPGSGKTTILKLIVDILKSKGINFSLMCPTGMASKRLSLLTNENAYTIHRYLGFQNGSWSFNEHNQINDSAIIIDEVSMLDQEILYRLILATPSKTRVMFVGDVDQLPSVGPGQVLRDLITAISSFTADKIQAKVVYLNKIFRQDKYSNIIFQAKKIRDGDTSTELFKSSLEEELCFIEEYDSDVIEKYIINIVTKLHNVNKESDKKILYQVITPRNNGFLSVNSLNTVLQNTLNPPSEDKQEIKVNGEILRINDKVVVKKNNYALDIFNGDIGYIYSLTNQYVSIYIPTDNRIVNIPLDIVEETLKLAYALTVHKCQGSEYDFIIMPLALIHGNFLLQRNLLYTAITRAKKKVIIIGSKKAYIKSVLNTTIQYRNTQFSERLKKCLEPESEQSSIVDLLCHYYQATEEEIKKLLLYL